MEILHKGKGSLMCTFLGHRYKLHPTHFTRKDKDGLKETFTCYVCKKCHSIKGVLAHKEKKK